jgi:hypothetical protein
MSRPVAWLWLATGGLLLVSGGVVLDAYRHDHGAGSGMLIGSSNPGVLVALSGIAVVAVGLLAGLSLSALQGVDSTEAVLRRAKWLMAAWVTVIGVGVGALTYVAAVGHDGHSTASSAAAPTPVATGAGTLAAATSVPGVSQRVTLRGTLTLDKSPFNARFLGARVTTDDGLTAACQSEIPSVTNGEYEITVIAEPEVHGCGAAGAQITLWVFVDELPGFVFTNESVPWPPADTRTVTFNAGFSTATPLGASRRVTELNGHVTTAGAPVPIGSKVEAFVGETLCGKSSVRGGDFVGYILVVAGPDAVPGCATGGMTAFRINGQPAKETSVNDLGSGTNGHDLDLTVP